MNFPNSIGITNLKRLLLALSVIAAGLLSVAFISQYGFDLHPCHLCLLQRYPYGAIIAIGLIGGFTVKDTRWQRNLAWLCVLLFLTDSGIAFYHAGVEAQWFPGPSGCTNSSTGDESLEEMRRQIMNAPLVTCDQAMIHVLGLSMAAWNSIAAAFLTVVSFIALRKLKS